MALTQLWNREWLDHNAGRRYPLAVDASGVDTTGAFTLPSDFLLGVYMSVPFSLTVDPASFMLKMVQEFSTGTVLTFGYWDGSDVITVASCSILKSAHVPYRAYELRGKGEFYDIRGQVVIGKLDNLEAQPAGEWSFDLAGGRLEVDSIRPYIRGVQQLRVQNGADLSDPISGDVVLRAGRNIRITPVLFEGEDPVIFIDAIEGEGLNEECVCDGSIETAQPIRTINRIGPAPNGDFTLLGSGCLNIGAITNGLQLHDTCAQPCCGCRELEKITDQLEQFGSSYRTLENFIVGLEARVSQMDQVVLGSKLGDQDCFSSS